MNEMIEWLEEQLEWKKRELEKVLEALYKMPIPDLVSRRVCETEVLVYRIALRKAKEIRGDK